MPKKEIRRLADIYTDKVQAIFRSTWDFLKPAHDVLHGKPAKKLASHSK
jgi:hypothetical protein